MGKKKTKYIPKSDDDWDATDMLLDANITLLT